MIFQFIQKICRIASYSLFILLLLPFSAGAVSCGSVDGSGPNTIDVTVTSDCINLVTTNIRTLTVNSGVTVKDDAIGGTEAITNEPGRLQIFNNLGTIASEVGGSGSAIWNKLSATIGTFNNTSSISTVGGTGLYNDGVVEVFSNAGNITGTSVVGSGENGEGITNTGTINSLINLESGTITVGDLGTGIWNKSTGLITELKNQGQMISSNGYSVYNEGVITTLTNTGRLYDTLPGYMIYNTGTISTLLNSGEITTGADGAGIFNVGGTITSLTNSGAITVGERGSGIQTSYGGVIDTIVNTGTITAGSNGFAVLVDNGSAITNLINSGTMSSGVGGAGIKNDVATISTLSNSQGAGNASGPLTYTGALPTNYKVIISSASKYGQLQATSISGSTSFGISTLSANVLKGTYSSVLSGITSGQITALSGSYNGSVWTLISSNDNSWNLIYGLSTADTQQSLVNTVSSLQSTYTLQNSVLSNSFSYDCALFDKNNVCISAGGRNTAVSAAHGLNNTSGLLIAAYRPHKHYRVGAYVDQNLSVNNAGSTVNLGNNTPLIGVFGAWNERLDGRGTEVKVSATYGQKSTTVNRAVVGTSEAGTGGSQLNSQGAQVTTKYGFGVAENVIVSPYAGIRYTQNNMGGYTESTSSAVTAPLTYSALNTNATTALAGVGASYRFIPQATAFASAGVETDTNTANGSYSATGVTGLTPINFNPNPVKTRPTAMVGATYDIERNQRLGLTGIYRQEPYQAVSSTTVMATYTVGL